MSPNDDLDYYTDKDLKIGSTINAWGRQLLIYDCDDFTKKFLAVKYSLDVQPMKLEEIFPDEEPAEEKLPTRPKPKPREAPPLPIPDRGRPRTAHDFVKFMTRDRSQSQSHILRFLAALMGAGNEGRRFVISYHLVDDTISVYEKPQRNSGYRGGRFMDRCRIKKWGEDSNSCVLAGDLNIGASVCLNGHWFQILDADDYALSYMEKHADEFLASNRLEVLRKLRCAVDGRFRQLKELFSEQDTTNKEFVDEVAFRNILRQIVPNGSLNAHEIVTLQRSYQLRQQGTRVKPIRPRYTDGIPPVDLLQKELKTAQFGDFQKLLQYLQQYDTAGAGVVSEERALRHCLAYPLPSKKHLIDEALQQFKTHEGEVDYQEFVKAIDWKTNPAVSSVNEPAREFLASLNINYKQLIKDMEQGQ